MVLARTLPTLPTLSYSFSIHSRCNLRWLSCCWKSDRYVVYYYYYCCSCCCCCCC